MYSPVPIRQFVTPAKQKRTQVTIINGRTQKQVVQVATLRGFFKQKGTSEILANGVEVVHERTSFTTWWKADLKSGDILEINGIDFRVAGQPENVEMRSRYAILTLERIEGGA